MQTFLPYENLIDSLNCLDYRRLGKQRLETREIIGINLIKLYPNKYNTENLSSVINEKRLKNHINHPCVKMWEKHLNILCTYGTLNCYIWIKKGYKDNQLPVFNKLSQLKEVINSKKYPLFLGNENFHSSHRAALLYKNYEFYSKYGWGEKPIINYKWSV
jgi:hypothetical protein